MCPGVAEEDARMRVWRCTAGVVLAATAVAVRAAPPEQLPWVGGLAAAFDEAKRRKAIVMVVLNMDGERGNDRMLAEVYTAAAVREAAKKVVPTPASLSKHAEVDDAKGACRVCSRFGRIPCADHCATEEVVRRDWLKRGPKDDVESPRHMFLTPEGKLLFERVWTIEPDELVQLIDRAARCDEKALATWDTTEARLARVADPVRCVRRFAVRDLLAARDATMDEKLAEAVRKSDKDDVVRDVLSMMGADANLARIDLIRKLLAAPSDAARREAAAAAVAAQKGRETFDALVAAIAREKHVETKCVLVRALAVAGGDPAATRDHLLHAVKSGEPAVRPHAAVALAPWARDDAVVDALRKVPANDKLTENLRAAAAWTLGLSGRKELLPELRAIAEERMKLLDRVVKAAAARLASDVEDPRFLELRAWIAPLSVQLPPDGAK
jgi:hypothetical protein